MSNEEHKKAPNTGKEPSDDPTKSELNDEDLARVSGGATRCGKCCAFYNGEHNSN